MTARLVHISCPDGASAAALARSLVDARLAACASWLPGLQSTYRWQGAIEESGEVLLLAKTWDDRVDALVAHVRAAHPYELPEIIAVEISGGLAPYLDWLHAETRPNP
jgi:periplasmic divalent cation tolerance protein